MSKTGIIELKCPKCSCILTGPGSGMIFVCFNCEIGFGVEAKGLGKYRLVCIKPAQPRDMEMIYFPFWLFHSRFQVLPEAPEQEEMFYIPAFFIKSISNYGDIGFYYLQKGVRLESEAKRSLTIFPGERDILMAAHYPAIYLAKLLSCKYPARPEKIKIRHQGAALALIPFYTDPGGSSYMDSQILWKYPPGALR